MIEKPLLQLQNAGVFRQGRRICCRLNWEIYRGEHWTILGPNGSGKSTLLSSIYGYESFSTGKMQVDGEVYGEGQWSLVRKKIGWVSAALAENINFQESVLHVVATGIKGILNHWKSPSREETQQAILILKRLGCYSLMKSQWGLLSQGEKQKVLIARSLVARPKILFLDEPCAGLDPLAREVFLRFLRKLMKRSDSPAVVLVTHHLEEIVPEFTHLWGIRKGRTIYQGEASEGLKLQNLQRIYGRGIQRLLNRV